MFTKNFWLSETGVLVRGARTFAQTAIAMLGVSQFSVFSIDWLNLIGVSSGAMLLSVLMSIDRNADSPKVIVEEIVAPAAEEPASLIGCGDSLR